MGGEDILREIIKDGYDMEVYDDMNDLISEYLIRDKDLEINYIN